MPLRVFFGSILSVIAILLQSTILRLVAIETVTPDLALIIVVYSGVRNGGMVSQATGFISGLVEDFFSLGIFGFHAFIKTLIGFLFGLTRGAVFVGRFLMPVLLVSAATLVKAVLAGILSALFGMQTGYSVLSPAFLVELAVNAVCAAPMFLLLGTVRPLHPGRDEVF